MEQGGQALQLMQECSWQRQPLITCTCLRLCAHGNCEQVASWAADGSASIPSIR